MEDAQVILATSAGSCGRHWASAVSVCPEAEKLAPC